MKTIQEWQKPTALYHVVKNFMKANWIFTTWYEKLILWVCVLWSGFSLIKFLL